MMTTAEELTGFGLYTKYSFGVRPWKTYQRSGSNVDQGERFFGTIDFVDDVCTADHK